MNHERYKFETNESFLDYEFESEGPKGKIKKVVRFSPQNANGLTYFNLAFGDWNEGENQIDDLATSANNDTQKVLATVAAALLIFSTVYPDMPIYAQGSTRARTRLYQMGIAANLSEIEPILNIYALSKDGKWEAFRTGVNYDAFMAWQK